MITEPTSLGCFCNQAARLAVDFDMSVVRISVRVSPESTKVDRKFSTNPTNFSTPLTDLRKSEPVIEA